MGLDIEAKARMLEEQIRLALGDSPNLHVLSLSLNGLAAEDLSDPNSATVGLRVSAQAR